MTKRKKVSSRGELLRGELNQTLDHAMRAAGHAAGGIGDAVRPKVAAARDHAGPAASRVRGATTSGWRSAHARLAPLTEAAQSKAKEQSKAKDLRATPARRRWPALAGLLAGGAALGALGAVLLRRRRRRGEGMPADEAASAETTGSATPDATLAEPDLAPDRATAVAGSEAR